MLFYVWKGTLVVPAEVKWTIQSYAADLTSRSLRSANRRGMPVVPAVSPGEGPFAITRQTSVDELNYRNQV